jgi:hypothetical protein
MRSYPIWNEVEACIYNSSKSYGAKLASNVNIKVGTSARNSHDFLTHRTTCRDLEDGSKEFRFYVDDKLIKRAVVTSDKKLKKLSTRNLAKG